MELHYLHRLKPALSALTSSWNLAHCGLQGTGIWAKPGKASQPHPPLQQRAFQKTHRAYISTCTLLCILSLVPLMIAAAFQAGDFIYILCTCLMLVIISVAVNGFVWSGTIQGAFQMLLQEESYAPEERAAERRVAPVAACYWSVITALYLGLSFYSMRWDRTWIVWPCAGVLYAAVIAIAKQIIKKF